MGAAEAYRNRIYNGGRQQRALSIERSVGPWAGAAAPANDPLGRIGPADRPERSVRRLRREPPARRRSLHAGRTRMLRDRCPCRATTTSLRYARACAALQRAGAALQRAAPRYSEPRRSTASRCHSDQPATADRAAYVAEHRRATADPARLRRRPPARLARRLPRVVPAGDPPATAAASCRHSRPRRTTTARAMPARITPASPMPIRTAGRGRAIRPISRLRRRGLSGCAGPAGLCAAALSARAGGRRRCRRRMTMNSMTTSRAAAGARAC